MKEFIDGVAKYNRMLGEVQRSVLNVAFPNDIELYMCALELVDQEGNTLRYFIFPIMPSNIEENQPQITNVKKTLAGVTVLSNPTFVPGDISLSGNFGRKFKILIGHKYVNTTASQGRKQTLDARVKTGYGCCKILEDIVHESRTVDSKGARTLIFYNLAIGNSYIVKPLNLKFSMSQDSNMIWNYSLSLKTIADLDSFINVRSSTKEERLVINGYVQKQVNRAIGWLGSIIR